MNIDYTKTPGRKLEKIKFESEEFEPIISIITPYYNSQKYIEETANCILNQTFPFWEWIIVNDGSTDKDAVSALEKIRKMDSRIRVLNKENAGPAAARDYGIERTNNKSKYLVFLDSDDMFNKTYLECAYWALETNPEASWTYTDVINFDNEEFLWRKYFDPYWQQKENLLVMASCIRKDKVKEIGGFKLREKKVYEDWYLWLRLLEKGNFPVRMSFLGTWYRAKKAEESELRQSNSTNKEIAMKYIEEGRKKLKHVELKPAIQFPKEEYNWEEIPENQDAIKLIPKKLDTGKINILMIAPWMTMGGADKFNLDLISKLDKEKYEVTILTTQPNANLWRQEFEEYATVYDLTSFLDRKNWLSFINYIIEANNINLIFNTNSEYGYNILPYLKAKYPEVPIIDYVHMEEWYWRNGGYSRDAAAFESVIDKTYICNENSRKILINHFGKNENEVETVYIGVDEKKFNPENYNKEEILEQLKISDVQGKYILSYICRIADQKRPHLLMKIIERLKQKRNDFKVVIAGDGPMLNDIKAEAKRLKIQDNIIFLGSVKETALIYKISDLTINCSIKEGLALTAYESLAMGVPVVTADVGGQKELVDETVGAVVPCIQKETEILNFNYSDQEIDSYVDAIEKVIKNLKQYKKNAREKIINGFTIDNMVEKMSNILEKTAQNPNIQKIENGKGLTNNINLTKEILTKFLISTKTEYEWTSQAFNRENIHILNCAKKTYEQTMEYKIKHPFVVILRKIGLYNWVKRNIIDKIK